MQPKFGRRVQRTGRRSTDYAEIAAYGVMSTPALVVDEQVVMAGRIPGPNSLKQTLTERLSSAATHQ
jgi:hypothetical protein